DAGTLTGSIGVVGGKVVYKELLEKVGVTVDVFQRGKNAGMFSSTERFSESQEQRFTGMLEETYRIFLDRVAESRHMTQDELEPSAQGRPLTGAQAKEGGLVDEIGGLQRAIEKAKVEAGISDDTSVSIVRVPNPESVLKVLFAGRDPGVKWPALTEITATMLPRDVRRAVSYVNVARELLVGNEAAALLPMHVEIR
ncbi:MAG: S49 family peptidase, partial [Planctomycetota bacterium]